MKTKNVVILMVVLISTVLYGCKKDDSTGKNPANNLKLDERILEYNSCWLPIATGGYLMSIHIMYNDSQSPTGMSKLYFTTSFSQCDGGLPEVDRVYSIGGGSSCRIVSGAFYILDNSNPRTYTGEIWYAKGDFTFTIAEKDVTNKKVHLAGTYNLILTDTEGVLHVIEEQSFDITDTYQ